MRTVMLALAVALAAADASAAEFRFELRNCHPKDIDVWVYNGGDIARVAAYSGWQGMKNGQTIGFACDEGGRGYCQVDVRIKNPDPDEPTRATPYWVDTTRTCFSRHESASNFIDGRCYLCPP